MDKRLRHYGGEITAEDFLKDEFRMNMKEIERRFKAIQSQIGTTSTSTSTSTTTLASGSLVFVGETSVSGTSFLSSYSSYSNYFGNASSGGWLSIPETAEYLVDFTFTSNAMSSVDDSKIFGYIGKNSSDFKGFTAFNIQGVGHIIGDRITGGWSGVASFAKNDLFNIRFYCGVGGTFQGFSQMCIKVTKL